MVPKIGREIKRTDYYTVTYSDSHYNYKQEQIYRHFKDVQDELKNLHNNSERFSHIRVYFTKIEKTTETIELYY